MNPEFAQKVSDLEAQLRKTDDGTLKDSRLDQRVATLQEAQKLMADPEAARPENVKGLIEYCQTRQNFYLLSLLTSSSQHLTPKTGAWLQQAASKILREEVLEGPEWVMKKERANDASHILRLTEQLTEGAPDKLLNQMFAQIAESSVLSLQHTSAASSSRLLWEGVITQLSLNIDRRLAGLLDRWHLPERKCWQLAHLRGAGRHTYQKLVRYYREAQDDLRGRKRVAHGLAQDPVSQTLPEVCEWLYDHDDPLIAESLLLHAPTQQAFHRAFQQLMDLLGEKGRETLLMVEGQQKNFITDQQLRGLLQHDNPEVRRQVLRRWGQRKQPPDLRKQTS